MFSLVVGFAIGAIPFAVIVARAAGIKDPRLTGSGNPGATNVARAGGALPGVIVLGLDVAKGAVAVTLTADPAVAGLGAVLGHCFSPFLAFSGGKGVATALGAIAALSPLTGIIAAAIAAVALAGVRIVSVASIIAIAATPLIAATQPALPEHTPLVLGAIALVVTCRHSSNIARLLDRAEPRFNLPKRKQQG